jgi:hypothetical protein
MKLLSFLVLRTKLVRNETMVQRPPTNLLQTHHIARPGIPSLRFLPPNTPLWLPYRGPHWPQNHTMFLASRALHKRVFTGTLFVGKNSPMARGRATCSSSSVLHQKLNGYFPIEASHHIRKHCEQYNRRESDLWLYVM